MMDILAVSDTVQEGSTTLDIAPSLIYRNSLEILDLAQNVNNLHNS